jgi:nucleotide-binding universal stress UspA family protein
MVDAALTCDLVIMAQAETDVGNAVEYHAQEHVIRRSGRPVLHIPSDYSADTIGKKVVIGWSPTREAARAVHDALPLISPGAEVKVVTIGPGASAEGGGAMDLARALDRHGFETEVVERIATRDRIAEELDEMAFEAGADLIVTGAFGHSRLYDFVIGAVTLDLMQHARLPVLFSR